MRFLKSLDNLSFIILAVMVMEMTRYSDFSNFTNDYISFNTQLCTDFLHWMFVRLVNPANWNASCLTNYLCQGKQLQGIRSSLNVWKK